MSVNGAVLARTLDKCTMQLSSTRCPDDFEPARSIVDGCLYCCHDDGILYPSPCGIEHVRRCCKCGFCASSAPIVGDSRSNLRSLDTARGVWRVVSAALDCSGSIDTGRFSSFAIRMFTSR